MKMRFFATALTGAMLLAGGVAIAQPKLTGYYADPAHPAIGGFWRPAPGQRVVFKVADKALPAADGRRHQLGFPYKPAWQKVVKARYAADLKGAKYGDPDDSCWPAGPMDDYVLRDDLNGLEIIQTPGRVELIHEYKTTVRWIYTDGRAHPTGDDKLYTTKGSSIGKWEGDTFVADTEAVRSEMTFGYNLPHSDQVHFVERFKRVDADTLQIDVTITDPVALTKPVVATLVYKKADPSTIQEKICPEEKWDFLVGNDLVVRPDTRVKKKYGFDLPPVQ